MENIDIDKENLPKHIAIIMDGNRRWAKDRELTTRDGHKEGAQTLEDISKFCNKIGIKYLTVYAFSTENWKRSKKEVSALMAILRMRVDAFIKEKDKQNIRIKVIGDIKGLTKSLQKSIEKAIEITKNNTGLTLNIAFNYGGRTEIIDGINQLLKEGKTSINEEEFRAYLYNTYMPDPELIIRTSGEFRTSNFLLWESAYSEYYITETLWPDFKEEQLKMAIESYMKRDRRFGGVKTDEK